MSISFRLFWVLDCRQGVFCPVRFEGPCSAVKCRRPLFSRVENTLMCCRRLRLGASLTLLFTVWVVGPAIAQPPDLILHHGKIATVDKAFSIAEAIAIRGETIVQVGKNDEVLA